MPHCSYVTATPEAPKLPPLFLAHPAFTRRTSLVEALKDGTLPVPVTEVLKAQLEEVVEEIGADTAQPRVVRLHAIIAYMMTEVLANGKFPLRYQANAEPEQPEQYEDPHLVEHMSKFVSENVANTLKGVDLYLDFAPEAAREAWKFKGEEDWVAEVLDSLRKTEEDATWGAVAASEEDGEDTPGLRFKLRPELTDHHAFEVWVEDYTPLGLKCPVSLDTLRSVTVAAIGILSTEEDASRQTRAAILSGLLATKVLFKCESITGDP